MNCEREKANEIFPLRKAVFERISKSTVIFFVRKKKKVTFSNSRVVVNCN